jgi:hypothetical protein
VPVKFLFAFLAICPLVVGVGIFSLGIIQRRSLRRGEERPWAEPAAELTAETTLPD